MIELVEKNGELHHLEIRGQGSDYYYPCRVPVIFPLYTNCMRTVRERLISKM